MSRNCPRRFHGFLRKLRGMGCPPKCRWCLGGPLQAHLSASPPSQEHTLAFCHIHEFVLMTSVVLPGALRGSGGEVQNTAGGCPRPCLTILGVQGFAGAPSPAPHLLSSRGCSSAVLQAHPSRPSTSQPPGPSPSASTVRAEPSLFLTLRPDFSFSSTGVVLLPSSAGLAQGPAAQWTKLGSCNSGLSSWKSIHTT